jgi:hypothetical protein
MNSERGSVCGVEGDTELHFRLLTPAKFMGMPTQYGMLQCRL